MHKSINTRYSEITPRAQTHVMTESARQWPGTESSLGPQNLLSLLTTDLQF